MIILEFLLEFRFIPACAGNSIGLVCLRADITVHPRLRGELLLLILILFMLTGSSPLARGTQEVKRLRAERLRFIPACAGNSVRSIL